MSLARIIGDLIGAYALHIAGAVGAYLVASEAYAALTAAAAPVAAALG